MHKKAKKVFIHQDSKTNKVISPRKPVTWHDFVTLMKETKIPKDFLSKKELRQTRKKRDPFKNWEE
jgi:hypothetical protein